MAKASLILRTNLANKNFTVQHKIIESPITVETVELVISPNPGYSIEASDFTTGYLSRNIRSINYINSGNKVIAKVKLRDVNKLTSNLNVALPINGIAKAIEHNISLVDTCPNDDAGDMIIKTISSFSTSSIPQQEHHCGDGAVHSSMSASYTAKIGFNTKILLLTKTFIAPVNNYFALEPNYIITGNSTRYTVESTIERDDDNRPTSKTFNIYYTSPKESKYRKDEDSICFTAVMSRILDKNLEAPKKFNEKEAINQEDYRIYSYSSGRAIGSQGGVKRIEIKGVPGTPFKIVSQDSNAAGTGIKTYNWKTSVFEVGGGMLTGVIPAARPNESYGSYVTYLKVPRNTVENSITTRLVSDEIVNHDLITEAATETNTIVRTDNSIVPKTNLTFTVASSGFTLPDSKSFIVGPGAWNESVSEPYIWKIRGIRPTSASNKISIIRQPVHDISAVYHNWDSAYGSDALKEFDSDGNAILTDWDVSGDGVKPDNSGAEYRINVKVIGFTNTDTDGYDLIDLEITISGVKFGREDVTPSLDLLNFLTLTTP